MAKKKQDRISTKKVEHYPLPDPNPPTDSARLAEINGKPTGQGFGAARRGPSVV
jgi:hypothetical protein